MKVLQFIPSVGALDGGTTTYMQQLTPVLGKRCELHVCTLTSLAECVALDACQIHNMTGSMTHIGEMQRRWMALLANIRPDVIHINCCWMPQIALVTRWSDQWRKSEGRDTKLLLTPHGMLEPWILSRHYWTRKLPAIWLYQRRAVERCDRLIATAEEERDHLMQLGWNKNIALVKNGIDVANVAMKEEWRAPRQLLFMSRIHPKKGLELLLEALANAKGPTYNNLTLNVAGTGEPAYVQALQEQAQRLGLAERVTFVGAKFGAEKWRMIREADAVVLPSYSENYGLIVAEALAAGTPVITTTGTPWQSIRETHCGWWIAAEVEALAHALEELSHQDAESMRQMGLRARTLAEEECAIDAKVNELYQLYLAK